MKKIRSKEDIEYVIKMFSDTIYKVALSHTQCPSTAEDMIQSTFIKYMENLNDFENNEHIKAWLIRVTINECKMFHRRFWNSKRVVLEDIYTFETEELHDIFYAVMNLPVKFRLVIHLYYYEEYSIKEISEIIGQKENTITSWLYRARKLLKEDMEVHYEH